jgi:hypothetical protein
MLGHAKGTAPRALHVTFPPTWLKTQGKFEGNENFLFKNRGRRPDQDHKRKRRDLLAQIWDFK